MKLISLLPLLSLLAAVSLSGGVSAQSGPDCAALYGSGSGSGGDPELEAVCAQAVAQGLATYPLADGVASLAFNLTATFTTSAASFGTVCGSAYSAGAAVFSPDAAAPPATVPDTTELSRVEPDLRFGCTPGTLYTLVMFDAGKACAGANLTRSYTPGFGPAACNSPFGYLHWARVNLECPPSGEGNATLGELYASWSGYALPANFELAPHAYVIQILEQSALVNASAAQQSAAQAMNAAFSFNLTRFLADGDFGFGSSKLSAPLAPVATSWMLLQASKFSAYQLGQVYGLPDFAAATCMALDAQPWYNAAAEQGILTAPLASGGQALDREITTSFTYGALAFTDPCNTTANVSVTLPAGSLQLAAATSANNFTTAQTRVQPAISWPCSAGEMFTLAMFDAGPRPVQPAYFGHWLTFDVPCDTTTNTSNVTAGKGWDGSNFTFFAPANPELAPHNYGFYVFKQAAAGFAPTAAQQASFARSGFNLVSFAETFQDNFTSNGPIARAWAWEEVSLFSAYQLDKAGFVPFAQAACASLGYPSTTTTTTTTTTTSSGSSTSSAPPTPTDEGSPAAPHAAVAPFLTLVSSVAALVVSM